MTRKPISGFHARPLMFLAAAAIANSAVAGSCDMQTQMQTAQTAEQQRRLNNITNSYQQLGLLNDLQNQCLASMPAVPTEVGGSTIIATAMNRIVQSTCNQLATKARSTEIGDQPGALRGAVCCERHYRERCHQQHGHGHCRELCV